MPGAGWLDILARTRRQLSEDNLSVVAAGVAFYSFLSVVPAFGVMVAVYGLVADPRQVADALNVLARVVPAEAMPLLREQLTRVTTNNHAAGVGFALGLVVALYSSASAVKSLMDGLNIAYGEEEKRGFITFYALALALTACAVIGSVVAVSLLTVLPVVLRHLPLGGATHLAINLARWPVLLGGFMLGLAVVYRYGPSRREARWAWVSWGAAAATLLWLVGSAVFSLYVSKFGSYDRTYGPLGAVVVFMMWLYLSAYVVLLGAELNSEMERQTLEDTTEGHPKPLGERGARSADTVGPARGEKPHAE